MNQNDTNWDACPDGELSRMVGDLRVGKRKQAINRAATATAATLLLLTTVGLSAALLRGDGSSEAIAPIACSRVLELFPQYSAGSLDPKQASQISEHLKHCERCRVAYGLPKALPKSVSRAGWRYDTPTRFLAVNSVPAPQADGFAVVAR